MLHRNWYPILDRFRTKYYEVIVNLAKEIDIAQKYLGNNPKLMAI